MLRSIAVCGTWVLVGAAVFARADQPVNVLYLQGEPPPGMGGSFQSFDRPNISETGSVLFTGDTDAPTSDDDFVFLGSMPIVQQGARAPGSGGGVFSDFESFQTGHQVNLIGDGVFITTLVGVVPTVDRAVYKFTQAGPTLLPIAQEGSPAPGIPGRFYSNFSFAAITDNGDVGFLADLDGSSSDDSVIYKAGAVLYRQGNAVPASLGLAPGTTWDADFNEIQWNGAGDLLFLGNTSLPAAGDLVLVRDHQGVPAIVAQEGQAVAARGGPDFLSQVQQVALAENSLWALRGTLGVAPAASDSIILSETGFYAQEGDPVLELPGHVLGSFNAVDINSHGEVVYLADLIPAGAGEGLFVNGKLLVRTGVAIAALPPITHFNDIGFEDVYVNDNRTVVFAAGYTGAITGDGLFELQIPPPAVPADTNCDGLVDGQDAGPFVLALLNPTQYALDFPVCGISSADVNGDAIANAFDIPLFAQCLLSGGCP